jgi:G3E family GTPase
MHTLTEPKHSEISVPKRGMPVTIITGFLGSGKTTLLNQILQNRQDLKVAVLVNEFGDINIDSQLLVSIDQDMVQLSNGCICCTINDDMVNAVYQVLERPEKVDYLVIETTGVADPLPIILTFIGSELRDLTYLDSIITLIDTETFTPEHFKSEAAYHQILYGDLMLLNKIDLASPAQISEIEAYVESVKSNSRILKSEYGKVPLRLLLDVGYTNLESYKLMDEKDRHSHTHDAHDRDHHHDHHHHHHHDHHHGHEHHHHHSEHLDNDGFVSISFTSDRAFQVHKFQIFLDELSTNVFRAKGILWFAESKLRHTFQLCGPRYTLSTDDWQQSPSNQIVLIGRNLDAEHLKRSLEACLS